MGLTRELSKMRTRLQREPALRQALLQKGIENFICGDLQAGKAMLRAFINATIGFPRLGDLTHYPAKSLMRMLGARGNPQARNLSEILRCLQEVEGVRFEIRRR
jgi:hypothetical protein